MKSIREVTKAFNLEDIRRRAEKQKADSRTSLNQDEPNYRCSTCQDEEGFLSRNGAGYEVWKDCECKETREIERLFQASAISAEFQKKTFEQFELNGVSELVRDAYTTAKKYVRDFGTICEVRQNSIALVGCPGSGKTHLLMAVANELLRRRVGVVYFPWVEGFNELKTDFSKLDERIWRLQRTGVLFIDDAFKGRSEPTEFQKEQLFAIVNHRYLEKLPMMVSSERTFEELCDIDEAIGSRIFEMARGHLVTLVDEEELNYRFREA